MRFKKGMLFMLLSGMVLAVASCSKDDENTVQPEQPAQTVLVKNLPADPATRDPNTGEVLGGTNKYTLFRFSDSTIVSNSDSASMKWDIGFRGTSIIINNSLHGPGNVTAQVVMSTLNELSEAPENGYLSDSEEGNVFDDWYNYNMQKHVITAKPGYLFIIRTNEDTYVKMEILSYYKDAPANPTSDNEMRYFTFRYVYQPDGSRGFTR